MDFPESQEESADTYNKYKYLSKKSGENPKWIPSKHLFNSKCI